MPIRAAREPRLALPTRPRPLWPLAIAGLLALASPAAAAPELAGPLSAHSAARKSVAAAPDAIRLAARVKKHSTSKARAKSKPKSDRKAAKSKAKPAPGKAAAVPLPAARPGANAAKFGTGFAPP